MYTGKAQDVSKFMAMLAGLMNKNEAGEDISPEEFQAILGETPEDLVRAETLLFHLISIVKVLSMDATYKSRALLP